jgi:hypothetical protein
MKLENVFPIYFDEAVEIELDDSSGLITFSTDLNFTLVEAETFIDKVKFFFDSNWKAFLNRQNVRGRLKKISVDNNIKSEYTLSRNLFSAHKSKNGITLYKKPYTMTVESVDSDVLILIATEICKEFKQETVMVRDFNKNKVYFINDKQNVKKDD